MTGINCRSASMSLLWTLPFLLVLWFTEERQIGVKDTAVGSGRRTRPIFWGRRGKRNENERYMHDPV